VRVSRRSQLTAALRQHAKPIVIEDQELVGPFVRLLRARQLRLWGLGEFVANTMSCGIDQSYGAVTLVVGFGLVHSALAQEPTSISTIVARVTGSIIRAF
jgi:hypothetical protein